MFKHSLLAIFALLCFTHVISTVATFNFLFERHESMKRSTLQTTTTTTCCQPNVFSLKGILNQVAIGKNATLQPLTGTIQLFADYNLGRIRQDATFSANGMNSSISSYAFKLSEKLSSMIFVARAIVHVIRFRPLMIFSQCVVPEY